MEVVSWNVRVIGSGWKRGLIKDNSKKLDLDTFIFQETKKELLIERLVGSLWKYIFRIYLPSTGSSGVLIVWDNRVMKVTDNLTGNSLVSI